MRQRGIGGLWVCVAAAACSTSSPRPVLSANDQLRTAGREVAERQIDACIARADRLRDQHQEPDKDLLNVVAMAATIFGGGSAGGEGYDACPHEVCEEQGYRRFVNGCLEDLGYRVVTWR